MDFIFDVLSLEERGTKSGSDETIVFEFRWQIVQHSREIVNIKLVQFGGMDLNVSTCKKKMVPHSWRNGHVSLEIRFFLLTDKGNLEQALQVLGKNLDN